MSPDDEARRLCDLIYSMHSHLAHLLSSDQTLLDHNERKGIFIASLMSSTRLLMNVEPDIIPYIVEGALEAKGCTLTENGQEQVNRLRTLIDTL